jgi:hypothetical protein
MTDTLEQHQVRRREGTASCREADVPPHERPVGERNRQQYREVGFPHQPRGRPVVLAHLDNVHEVPCLAGQDRVGRDEAADKRYAAADIGIPLHVVAIDDPAVARLYERRLVLVRPDGMVAWRADTLPDDVAALVGTVSGSIPASSTREAVRDAAINAERRLCVFPSSAEIGSGAAA